ncbi:MAG: terpene cyclase/mutase family protein [Candidatus Sumerlaeia bacterium]|nr:terpene cyclase/mutase family protein [Candidatus Sumerlaeia bacterium]
MKHLIHFIIVISVTAVLAAAIPLPCPAEDELTPAAEQAIAKALDWLARQQRPDGSLDDSTADTALAGLAWMVVGETPGRGKYARQSSRALQYILTHVEENGLIIGRNRRSPMYHHGVATLYLTQAWGLTGYESIREKLKKAVDLIITTQSTKGGWRYFPGRDEQDISVTVMQVVALRAARNCGIEVPERTIQRAIEYVRSLSHPEGGFGYQSANDRGIARTGAGMFSLQVCGEYNDPRIALGLRYLERNGLFDGQWEHYGLYYISAALYQIGGETWEKNYPIIRERLVKSQKNDGSWGENYKTAMAVLTLAIPYHFLPIYQR